MDNATIQVLFFSFLLSIIQFQSFDLYSDYVNETLSKKNNLEQDWVLNVLPVNLSLSFSSNEIFELKRKSSNESCSMSLKVFE